MHLGKVVTVTLILMIITLVSSFIIAIIGYTSINALGKNPSLASRVMLRMFLFLVIAEIGAIGALSLVLKVFN
ncbi:MAG: hypothetical protein WC980_00280 [Candidatus Brocadiia bacterium]